VVAVHVALVQLQFNLLKVVSASSKSGDLEKHIHLVRAHLDRTVTESSPAAVDKSVKRQRLEAFARRLL